MSDSARPNPRISRRDMVRATAGGLIGALTGSRALRAAPAFVRRVGSDADSILLGVSAAFSGPSRSLGIELYRGAMSYFSHINENGGVNGRRIELKVYDDGYQPDPCVENTLRLIREDQVFLLFGYVGTPTVTRALPVLKKFQDERAYLLFPFTGAQPQREPPYGEFAFNLRASYRQETAQLVDRFVEVDRPRIGMFYQADAYGRSGWAGVRGQLATHDLNMVAEATYTRGTRFTGSMRRQVEILMDAEPDAVICVGSYAACAALVRDAVDMGLRVPFANLSFVGSESLLQLLTDDMENSEAYTSLLVNSQVVPSYEDASTPAVLEYRDLMQRYDPPPPEELLTEPYDTLARSFVSFEGFLNAKMMTEILGRLDGEPDRSGLEDAVFSVSDYDIGIGSLVSFGPNRRQGLQTVYHTVVDDGRFVPLLDWGEKFGQ